MVTRGLGACVRTAAPDRYGCILSTSKLDASGYAYAGKSRAHIVAWTAVNGPVPAGMFVDHGCRRRACKQVLHLEAVTRQENELRKQWAYRCRIKRCPMGLHGMEDAIVVLDTMGRVCRACVHGLRQER